MKKRVLIGAGLLVAGFLAATSITRWRTGHFGAYSPSWSGPATVLGSGGVSADEQNNIDIYKKAREATVNITSTVYRQNFFLEIYPQRDSGSGFFIDNKGSILTNYHVVSGRAPEVQVTLSDGSKYNATVVNRDPENDLALIKITPKKEPHFLALGDSEHIQVGQKVLAIGNPFGLEGTLTTGIISSLGRDIADESGKRLSGMIQTDAAINPGNSGGPLLDSQGNVIGINTAIYGPGGNIGIGFAMPINRAKLMLEAYRSGKRFGRPFLGVDVALVQGDLAAELELPREGGLLIQQVRSGSAAEEAGLRGARQVVVIGNYQLGIGGDLILAIDGHAVDRIDALTRALSAKRPGDTMNLTIFRGGRKTEVKVRLGEISADNV